MAIVSNNDLTLGLRGRVGKFFVFRTFRGKTIASHAPRKPDPRKQSDAQRKTRVTFREAAAWAVQTLKDPAQRHYFDQRAKTTGLPNAYTAAVQQRMRWSSGLDGETVSFAEKSLIHEEPTSASVVRAPASLCSGSVDGNDAGVSLTTVSARFRGPLSVRPRGRLSPRLKPDNAGYGCHGSPIR